LKKENIVYKKAYQFAIRIVNAYQFLNKEKMEFIISKQLVRCGTSIGVNISETDGAISKADFSNKVSITYKECLEVKYWLSLLKDTSFIDNKTFQSIYLEADEIGKILYLILKSTRIRKK